MDLTIYKNKTANFSISYVSDSVAVDLTGWTIVFMAKRKKTDDDDDAVIAVVLENGAPTTGVATLILAPNEADVSAGTYVYDIQAFPSGAGEPTVVIDGLLTVKQPVRNENP